MTQLSTPDPAFRDDLSASKEHDEVQEQTAKDEDDDQAPSSREATWLDYLNLVITRIVFAFHLLVTTWKCAEYMENNLYFAGLVIGLVIMAVETVFAIVVRKGKGYKWVSPTILIYLWTILPMIWRLEIYMFEERVALRDRLQSGEGSSGKALTNANGETTFTQEDNDTKLKLQRQWVSHIEQVLIFTLIIGRWMLPKGDMTRDEVTRLLMSYIGMSADIIGCVAGRFEVDLMCSQTLIREIVPVFEAFRVFEVMYNETLTYSILVCWSVAMLQFAFVIVAAQRKVTMEQYTDDGDFHVADRENFGCGFLNGSYWCDSEVVGCLVILLSQDLPFCVLRIVMSVGFGATHYMHTFFIGKNILVCMIMVYKMLGARIDRGMKTNYSEIDE